LRLIHRYWTGPDEPPVDPPVGTVWHDGDLPYSIAAWVDAREAQVRPSDVPRHRSNMVRWWLLLEHGGLWLDHDARLHDDPPDGNWVAAANPFHACAAAIQLLPRHPLAYAMLDHIARQPPSTRTAPQVSGAHPLTNLARHHNVRLEPIPGPGRPPTWISHDWATSMTRH